MFVYLLGVFIALILAFFYEYLVYSEKCFSVLTAKDWIEDICLSLFSWLTVILTVALLIGAAVSPESAYRYSKKDNNKEGNL